MTPQERTAALSLYLDLAERDGIEGVAEARATDPEILPADVWMDILWSLVRRLAEAAGTQGEWYARWSEEADRNLDALRVYRRSVNVAGGAHAKIARMTHRGAVGETRQLVRDLTAAGRSKSQIAAELHITESTVAKARAANRRG